MSGIEILGTGSYVPEFVADNNKFAEFLDTSDEWITPRTGIKQRHILTDKPGSVSYTHLTLPTTPYV